MDEFKEYCFFIHCCRYGFTEIDNIHITCTDSSYIKYPSTEKRSGHKVPYLTNKLSIIDTCWEKKKGKYFLNGQLLGVVTTLQDRTHAQE